MRDKSEVVPLRLSSLPDGTLLLQVRNKAELYAIARLTKAEKPFPELYQLLNGPKEAYWAFADEKNRQLLEWLRQNLPTAMIRVHQRRPFPSTGPLPWDDLY